MSKWISVDEALPVNQIVLVCTNAGNFTFPKMFVSLYSHDTQTWCDIRGFIVTTDSIVLKDCKLKVTHWIPLPKPPEESK